MNILEIVMYKLKVCIITATRAEYGLLRWLMQEIKDDPAMDLQILVTGTHFSEKYGQTHREIENDGFTIDKQIPLDDDSISVSAQVAYLMTAIEQAFTEITPDCIVVMGDRYELLAVASVCLLKQIPLAHISGGEISEGAFDNQIRHAVTKIANFHCVANEEYAQRVQQMGEEDWRVCISGEPGLDNLTRLELMSQSTLEENLDIDLSHKTAVVTFHPVTLEGDSIEEQINALCDAMQQVDMQYVITLPNSDPGNDIIRQKIEEFAERNPNRVKAFKSLGQLRYLSLLKYASMMIGNSSSGIVEAPSFNLPVVNVGNRQKGRTCATNVIHVACEQGAIVEGIQQALHYDAKECVNPYGRGNASGAVKEFLKDVFQKRSRQLILTKKFIDYAI